MRVTLVNPPPDSICEPYYDTPPFPRSALAFLAAFLRDAGVEVSAVDCKYSRLGYQETLGVIREINPDVVALTACTNEIIQAGRIARLVKAWRPEIITVIGGVHVTALPERTLREFREFDFAVLGEGEIPLKNLVHSLEMGLMNYQEIPGIARLDEAGIFQFGGDGVIVADLNLLPVPAWDLFPPAREYIVHTSRGCPFHCPFCMNFNGRKVRTKSTKAVLDEVEYLAGRGARSILFGDEVFTLNRARTAGICKGLIERGLHRKIRWWCVSHLRCIDFDLAVLMKEAGCYLVGLGIEAGSDARLSEIDKGTTLEIILETTKSLKKAGLPFEAYCILGYPDETVETAKETVDFLVRINPDRPVIGIMVPYPGTRIAEMAEKGEGGYLLQARGWNDYNKQIGNAISFKNLSRRQLERIQLLGYLKVFLFNYRFLGFIRFFWQYRLLAWKAFLKTVGGRNHPATRVDDGNFKPACL